MSFDGFIVRVQPQACLVYPAEIEQARALMRERIARTDMQFPPGWGAWQARRALRERPHDLEVPYLVPELTLGRALHDLMHAHAATPSLALARVHHRDSPGASGVPIDRAWKDEFALWLFRSFKGAAPVAWSADVLNKHRPENSLSFLGGLRQRAGGRPIRYVAMDEVMAAQTLEALLEGPLPPMVDAAALMPYLRWLNEASTGEEGYFLGKHAKSPAGGD